MNTTKCNVCNHEGQVNSNYCSNCGAEQDFYQKKSSGSDKLIFVFTIVAVSITCWWLLMDMAADWIGYKVYDKVYYLNRLMDLISMGSVFLLVFAIRSRPLRSAALVLAIVQVLIRLYWFIDRLISDFTYDFEPLDF